MVDRKRINATVSDLAGSCSVRLASVLDAMLAPLVGNRVRGLNRGRNAAQQTGSARPVPRPRAPRDAAAHDCKRPRRGLNSSTTITVLTSSAAVGPLITVIATHRHAFHIARGPRRPIPQGRLPRPPRHPAQFSSRRAAVQAACEPAPIDVPATGHSWREIADRRGRTTLDIKTR